MDDPNSFWNPEKIALVAAVIGAVSALLTQLIIHFLNRSKASKTELRGIIGEERRLAYLIEQYFKEVVMYKTHKMYWYKISTFDQYSKEERADSHKRHVERNEKSFEAIDKVQSSMAEYFKVVAKYLHLEGDNKEIESLLEQIKNFKPRKASNYDGIESFEELFTAQDKDEDELNTEYGFYSKCFDKIYGQMIK